MSVRIPVPRHARDLFSLKKVCDVSPDFTLDHQGAGIVITTSDSGAFMFQINDERHPDPRCRGRFQLWGGRMELTDGSPFATLERELYEEWRNQDVAREVLQYVKGQDPASFTLHSNGGTGEPYMYGLHVYFAVVPAPTFMDWFTELERMGFNEGRLCVLTRDVVEHYIHDTSKQRLFLGHQLEVLEYYFEHNKVLRFLPALTSPA